MSPKNAFFVRFINLSSLDCDFSFFFVSVSVSTGYVLNLRCFGRAWAEQERKSYKSYSSIK